MNTILILENLMLRLKDAAVKALAVDSIDQCADTDALQSSLCVLSWSLLTALMECIKLSTDITN